MSLFEKHKELVDRAVKAIHERTFYAAYPEIPKAYGEDAVQKGNEAYNSYLNKNFPLLLQKDSGHWEGEEISPYTQEHLGGKNPIYHVEELIEAGNTAFKY